MKVDVNLVTVIVAAIPATLAALASFIQTLRNGTKLDQHGQQMTQEFSKVTEAVNGKMDQAIVMAKAQGRQDERDDQKAMVQNVQRS
jgi:hypothetical protein